jgi:hypothetical protein
MAKKKIILTGGIICGHCGQDSGWTRVDISQIRGDHDLKCQQENCGLITIRHRAGASPSDIPKSEPKEKKPWGQRGVKKYVKKTANDNIF